jgi:hypothetical protein
VAAERELQGEELLGVGPLVVGEEELHEELFAAVGDAVRLAGSAPGAGQAVGDRAELRGGDVTRDRPRRDRRRGRDRSGRDDLDRPVRLEATQSGIERTVRDAPEEAQRPAEPLLQLVPVQRLLFEEAKHCELEHLVAPPEMGFVDISSRYIEPSL